MLYVQVWLLVLIIDKDSQYQSKGTTTMKHISILLLFALTLLITAGCGSAGPAGGSGASGAATVSKETGGSKESSSPNKESSGSKGAQAERTIKHAMGTATLKKTPERVVYLFQSMNDVGVALGVKPVGAIESTDQKPWFKYLGDMSGVKSLGDEGQPNLEAIIALKPDLIIATKTRHEKIVPQLEAIAPTVVTEDLADWKDNLRLAGEALGKQEQAESIMKEWNSRVADFKKKMGTKLETTTVSVIRVQRDNSVKVYLKGFPGLFMRELGLGIPKAQQVTFSGSGLDITSKEHIPQFDADYIFDITTPLPGQENVPKLQEEWTSHPLWKSLNAVKNGKVIKADPITWNFGAGPLAAKAMLNDMFRYFGLE
jgi:iron complex transport system substrate-binding protein